MCECHNDVKEDYCAKCKPLTTATSKRQSIKAIVGKRTSEGYVPGREERVDLRGD